MTRVTIEDLRRARYCLAGVRPWFRRHGFDWPEFLARGIAADRLRATGDALVEPVIRIAETREMDGREKGGREMGKRGIGDGR
ncbi:MAG: hypothetical protein ACK4WC_11705 [Rubrimonas sp.]